MQYMPLSFFTPDNTKGSVKFSFLLGTQYTFGLIPNMLISLVMFSNGYPDSRNYHIFL